MEDCKLCGLFDAYLCPSHAEARERELEAKAAGKLEGPAEKRHELYESRSMAGSWQLTMAEALEAEVGTRRGGHRQMGTAAGSKRLERRAANRSPSSL